MRSFLLAAVLILSGCHHTAPGFDWANACSDALPCRDEDEYCAFEQAPNGEMGEYGQCVDFED